MGRRNAHVTSLCHGEPHFEIYRTTNTMQNKTMFMLWHVQYTPIIIYMARDLLCFPAVDSMALICIMHAYVMVIETIICRNASEATLRTMWF